MAFILTRSMKFYLALLCFLILMPNAHSHQLGESYIFLDISEHTIKGRVEITTSDLGRALDLDKNSDGKINQEELDSQIDMVKSYLSERIKLGVNPSFYSIQYTTHEIFLVSFGKFAVINFIIDNLQHVPTVLDIHDAVLFDIDEEHRGLLVVEYNYVTGERSREEVALIFSPKQQQQKLDLTSTFRRQGFLAFLGLGIWHIWIGIDHILFLVSLILPAVLYRQNTRWEPVPNFRPALIKVVKIVTLFTIAHTITLSLAALNIIGFPARIIESLIALSVVFAALNNVFPFFVERVWVLIFGFGLFHGFGFANVLAHLRLKGTSLVLSLFGFNLGVEIGQVAIICIVFTLFYALRLRKFYPNILKFGSALVALIALLWFIERAFNLESVLF
jgi:hypothetical protein